jgi:Omp85 superfamily domain
MLSRVISFAGFSHLQSFDSTIKDITTYNFPARNLDRRMANEPGLKQWIEIAEDLKHSLTDAVIEQAVGLLPPEVFPVSGNEMISNLKSRRNHLAEYATAYYKFIAKEVDIPGTDKKEFFEINRLNDNETNVKIYKIKKDGEKGKHPLYNRTFFTNETHEIRLYGMGDNDIFRINGSAAKGILIRISGGEGKDSILDGSSVAGSKKLTQVYDSEKSGIISSAETRLHISNDSVLNSYNYKSYEYDDKGISVKPGFLSLTIGFGKKTEHWRKEPVGHEQSIKIKYSFTRAAVNIEYNTILYQALGKWTAGLTAGAGIPSVVNFFGIGNESKFASFDRRYFRLRSHEYYGKIGLNRKIKSHSMEVNGFYQTVKIKEDETRFITAFKDINIGIDLERKHFVGGEVKYKYQKTNDAIVPVKGFTFQTAASYTYNLNANDRSFTRLTSDAAVYIPVFKFISFAFRAGGSTMNGNPEFYQLNMLGSHENLRGFRKQRFYGKQTAYSNNEVRLIFNVKSKLFNGKMGLIGFYDIGRVWHPGEQSDIWHAGYGPGVFLSLFNKVTLSAAYGISKEDRVISAYVGFYF